VKDFTLGFARLTDRDENSGKLHQGVFPLVKKAPGRIIFLQVYLMPKRQFEELVPHLTQSKEQFRLPNYISFE